MTTISYDGWRVGKRWLDSPVVIFCLAIDAIDIRSRALYSCTHNDMQPSEKLGSSNENYDILSHIIQGV
jgi:hypothetical protein